MVLESVYESNMAHSMQFKASQNELRGLRGVYTAVYEMPLQPVADLSRG